MSHGGIPQQSVLWCVTEPGSGCRIWDADASCRWIPLVMTNLSGFGCFMQDLIEHPQDEGCYIVVEYIWCVSH